MAEMWRWYSWHSDEARYTTGDSSSGDNDGPSPSRQKNIPAKQYPTVHQSTLKHNLGKKTGEKGTQLTTTVYSSEISSAAVMTLHSTEHKRHFDCVSGSSSELKECLEVKDDYDKKMTHFWIICRLLLNLNRKLVWGLLGEAPEEPRKQPLDTTRNSNLSRL